VGKLLTLKSILRSSFSPVALIRRLRMAVLRRRFGAIGAGSWIGWPIDVLTEPAKITLGEGVSIRSHVRLEVGRPTSDAHFGRITIGPWTSMEGYCSVAAAESIEIGSNVLIGANVAIRDADHGFRELNSHRASQPLVSKPVRIGDFVWLGQNVVVLKGADIGRGAVVGANAVVTGSVPEGAIVAGVPARQIGWADGRPFRPGLIENVSTPGQEN
jgi:acetyltransferase-like isoleucine patch superfamily enzyme